MCFGFGVESFLGALILKEILGFFLCSLLKSFQVLVFSFGRECYLFLTSGLALAMHFVDSHFQVLSQIFKNFECRLCLSFGI